MCGIYSSPNFIKNLLLHVNIFNFKTLLKLIAYDCIVTLFLDLISYDANGPHTYVVLAVFASR